MVKISSILRGIKAKHTALSLKRTPWKLKVGDKEVNMLKSVEAHEGKVILKFNEEATQMLKNK